MTDEQPVEPFPVARMVEQYVNAEHREAAKFSNREPLDESGAYNLHTLAALVYQLGFNEGRAVEGWRQNEHHSRERATAIRAAAEKGEGK